MQHETKQKLDELLKATGHVLDVNDIPDIIELDRLADQVADPQNGIDSPLTNHAVFFRSVPVYPLTLAHLTLLDYCGDAFGVEGDDRLLFMLWICTIKEITDDHYGPDTKKALKKWARRSPWTPKDIDAILELRYGKLARQAEGSESGENNDGALIGMLSREYGGTPDHWMYRAPLGLIETCTADWTSRQAAQAAAHRKANPKAGAAPAPSPKFVTVRKFRECAEKIEAKWQEA